MPNIIKTRNMNALFELDLYLDTSINVSKYYENLPKNLKNDNQLSLYTDDLRNGRYTKYVNYFDLYNSI